MFDRLNKEIWRAALWTAGVVLTVQNLPTPPTFTYTVQFAIGIVMLVVVFAWGISVGRKPDGNGQ